MSLQSITSNSSYLAAIDSRLCSPTQSNSSSRSSSLGRSLSPHKGDRSLASRVPSPHFFQDCISSPPEALLHITSPSSQMTLGYQLSFERCPDTYHDFKKVWKEIYAKAGYDSDVEMKVTFDDETHECMIDHSQHEILALVKRYPKLNAFFYSEGKHIFADFFFRNGPLATRISQQYHLPQALARACRQLLDDALIFEKTRAFIKTCEQSAHSNGEPPCPVYKNFIIDESHAKSPPIKFVIENIKMFKDNQVTTIFVEHLFYDTMQTDIDGYLKSPLQAPLPIFLEAYVSQLDAQSSLDSQFGFKALLALAKAQGIRLVGISTEASAEAGNTSARHAKNPNWHQLALNYQAVRIIQSVEKQGNYAIICRQANSLEAEGIPSLDAILKCKRVNALLT